MATGSWWCYTHIRIARSQLEEGKQTIMRMVSQSPESIVFNASIYTVNSTQPWASALAIRDGAIIAIGDDHDVLGLAGERTETLDLGGRLVLPGFCDAHIHFYDWSLAQSEVDLAGARSKDEMLRLVECRATDLPENAWVIGRGWNESWWGETEYPLASDLDGVTRPGQPAIFWRSDMHAAVVNSWAMKMAGITERTPDPTGGVVERNERGAATGILKELAIALVADLVPDRTAVQALAAVRDGISELHKLGVTAVHDQRMKGHDDGIHALATYQTLNREGQLGLRVNCNLAAHQLGHLEALGLSYGLGDDRLRLGHVKVFADGSLGSQTALLNAPFLKTSPAGPDNFGVRLTEPEEMAELFHTAARLGFPISVHAIGDRANQEVLDIFEELRHSAPQPPAPHRIEHVQIIRIEDIGRLAALGITASVQPVHVIDDIDLADRLLGERGARMYNFRSLLEAGALVAFGSDAPVANPSPLLGIHAAIYRQRPARMQRGSWYEAESVLLEQAIYAYTMAPARATGWQEIVGSIELGKRADINVLDRNLFEIAQSDVVGDEIADTKVDLTMFDGHIVHSRL